ncbi:NUDIX hydrolase [Lactobacillus sp. ESL0791]|uniref:NUDIX hydrolase N-terminal domain-containing protein n=1 Tax=Lactobacillus sp. ESL0791 TaxID=2983234 RepID=UPI0023F6ABB5|nr:NUDIX hydrolase [Lactobacillus sp. ESL0791]MDF7638899.1 NUDIX hydrolase [Lactobacillus sp. ESL0791]
MQKIDDLTSWAVELQSLAQEGLEYGHDKFDRERYQRIREIATEMMSVKTGLPYKQVKTLFSSEDGYQTPKLATRAAIIKDNKILLVKEKTDDRWALPGGWCDVNVTLKENCLKETKEESGRNVKVDRLIAIQDYNHHNRPQRVTGVTIAFFLCHEISGEFIDNIETADCKYFAFTDLPKLSEHRNSKEQIKMCFEAAKDPNWQPIFD